MEFYVTRAPTPNPRFALEADAEYEQAKSVPAYQTIPRTIDGEPAQRRPFSAMSLAVLVLVLTAGYWGYSYQTSPSAFSTQSAPGKTEQIIATTGPAFPAPSGNATAPTLPTTP